VGFATTHRLTQNKHALVGLPAEPPKRFSQQPFQLTRATKQLDSSKQREPSYLKLLNGY